MNQTVAEETSRMAESPLLGVAALTTLAFRGDDFGELIAGLVERINQHVDDAAAWMDLAIIHFLMHESEQAETFQQQAMALRQRYRQAFAPEAVTLRMLAVMGPGGMMDNLPLEFLLADGSIAMDMQWVRPGAVQLDNLDDYDLIFVAVGESDRNAPLLAELAEALRDCPLPVLNRPEHVMQTTREGAAQLLQDLPGVVMPPSVRVTRAQLQALAAAEEATAQLRAMLPGADFPVIVRPVESHAGHGLLKVDQAADLLDYLAQQAEPLFYISPFIDYASADGQFRKYRVALIEGEPYLCHLAISSHWMVHYLNADMVGDAVKCAEEAACMADFAQGFGGQHAAAFAAIAEAMQLEYLILDCAESRDGRLLVFEVDTSAIVHAMDPEDIFPYKKLQMQKIFRAFQAMLQRKAGA